MLPGIRTVTGRVVLTTDSPPAGTAFQGGLPLSPDGAVHATSNAPTSFVNGFGTDASGALCFASGVILNYSDGLPRGSLGVLIGDSGADGPNDSFVGGVRVGTDGIKVDGLAGPWTPLDLFAGGKKGAWYDPSDLSTMFQDSAGTTPVTADGQPVGLILDKSGNGNHASQPVAGKRPTYRTGGGTHWLDFDGVDDSLYTASINLTSASKITVFAGTTNAKTLSTGTLLEFSPNYLNNAGSFAMLTPSLATSHISFGSHGTSAAGEKETQEAPVGLTRPRVLTCAQDFGTLNDHGCDYIRFNQIPVANLVGAGNTDVGPGPLGTWPAYIGARNNGSNAAAGNSLWGRVYSLIFVGEMYDQATLVKAEEWIDAKMVAVYMPIWSRYYNVDPALGADATFTRAGTAYVRDHLGIYRLALANEARFEGSRRVRNFITQTENFAHVEWTYRGVSPVHGIAGPDGSLTAVRITALSDSLKHMYVLIDLGVLYSEMVASFWIRRVTGTGTVGIKNPNATTERNVTAQVTTEWKRFASDVTTSFNGNSSYTGVILGTTGDVVEVWHPQLEEVVGQTNKSPGGYLSNNVLSAPYHGAGVDGVKYFDTTNGNTVDANGVVTEAPGAPIDPDTMYLLMEPAATNYALNSSVPATHTTGSLPIGSYVCWIVGSGSVAVTAGTATLTGNGTATAGTPDAFSVTVAGTITLTVTGTVTWLQVEGGSVPTSRIYTTTTPVTRAADALAYSGVPADNETLFTNNLGVETTPNDWNGTVPVPGTYRSIEVYNPGERP